MLRNGQNKASPNGAFRGMLSDEIGQNRADFGHFARFRVKLLLNSSELSVVRKWSLATCFGRQRKMLGSSEGSFGAPNWPK